MLAYLIEHSLHWREFFVSLTGDLHQLLPSLHNRVPLLQKISVHRCHNLVVASITTANPEAEWSIPSEFGRIKLPHLRCVYVSHSGILATLRVPKVEQITIYSGWSEAYLSPSLYRFTKDSSNTVRRLALRGHPTADFARKILQRYPALTDFAVILQNRDEHGDSYAFDDRCYSSVNNIITILETTDSDTALCPQLSRIEVAFEGGLSIDYGPYLQMLESRFRLQPHANTLYYEQNPRLRVCPIRRSGLGNSLHVCDVEEHLGRWYCKQTWNFLGERISFSSDM
ncbi:hypothetical protein FB45DRAFT_1127672 [Roridomyces roridus]|uniref:Uncharacterized protein n=1 Tax=Roridomyces roridus TaxID=1738132 RepID=A0AAD7FAU0_9AGAR|nr:hypothetical protein FB45DRAFT_1127672 [Roridomyces roridus]